MAAIRFCESRCSAPRSIFASHSVQLLRALHPTRIEDRARGIAASGKAWRLLVLEAHPFPRTGLLRRSRSKSPLSPGSGEGQSRSRVEAARLVLVGRERGRHPIKRCRLPSVGLTIAVRAPRHSVARAIAFELGPSGAPVGRRACRPRSHQALAPAKNFGASKGFSRRSMW